jgi:hypothetical protein
MKKRLLLAAAALFTFAAAFFFLAMVDRVYHRARADDPFLDSPYNLPDITGVKSASGDIIEQLGPQAPYLPPGRVQAQPRKTR